jgi:SPP1 gp7 family putative phage head morphogenesis protein
VLAAYTSPAPARYVSLWPRRDLGGDLALALLATGQRTRALAPVGFAAIVGQSATVLKARTLEEARLEAIGIAFSSGEVEIAERVGAPAAHLYYRREVMKIAEIAPGAGELVAHDGTIAKAANVRSPVEFRRIVSMLSGQLSHADKLATAPALTKALQKLNVNWAALDSAAIRSVFDTFNATMKATGTSKALKGYSQQVTVTANMVGESAKKMVREKFLPRIGVSLSSPNVAALAQIGTQQGWFLRDELGFRSDSVTAMGRKVVHEGLAAGLGTYEIADDLQRRVPGMWNQMGKNYANVVAANALSRSRTYSELSSYQEAGIKMLEIVAVLDERTSDICRAMDGQCIPVDGAMGIATAAANVKKPEDVRKVAPFVRQSGNELFGAGKQRIGTIQRSGVGNADDRGSVAFDRMGSQLLGCRIGPPPFHFSCRTTTVPRMQMVQVPRNYEARSLGTVNGLMARTQSDAAQFSTGISPVNLFAAPGKGKKVISGSAYVPTVPAPVGLYKPTPLSEYEARALWATGMETEGAIVSRQLVSAPGAGAHFLDVSVALENELRRAVVRIHPEDLPAITRSVGAVKPFGAPGRPIALKPAEKYAVPAAGRRGRTDYEMLALKDSKVKGGWIQRSWVDGKQLMVEVTNSATVKTIAVRVTPKDLERVRTGAAGVQPKLKVPKPKPPKPVAPPKKIAPKPEKLVTVSPPPKKPATGYAIPKPTAARAAAHTTPAPAVAPTKVEPWHKPFASPDKLTMKDVEDFQIGARKQIFSYRSSTMVEQEIRHNVTPFLDPLDQEIRAATKWVHNLETTYRTNATADDIGLTPWRIADIWNASASGEAMSRVAKFAEDKIFHAIHAAAAEEFASIAVNPQVLENISMTLEEFRGFKKHLRAMYNATQEYLVEIGVPSEVTLVRGIRTSNIAQDHMPQSASGAYDGTVTIGSAKMRPLESWSSDPDGTAAAFGTSGRSYKKYATMRLAKIPRERIFSVPSTGLGLIDEQEFVILGGENVAKNFNTRTGHSSYTELVQKMKVQP